VDVTRATAGIHPQPWRRQHHLRDRSSVFGEGNKSTPGISLLLLRESRQLAQLALVLLGIETVNTGRIKWVSKFSGCKLYSDLVIIRAL